MSPEFQTIAHDVGNLQEAEVALSNGFTLVEVDVSLGLGRFVGQHNGIKGFAGIGTNLREIAQEIDPRKIIWDLKHFGWGTRNESNTGAEFGRFLIESGAQETNICGTEHGAVSAACKVSGANPYFSFLRERHINGFRRRASSLVEPVGMCIESSLVTPELVEEFRGKTNRKIFVWGVKSAQEAAMLIESATADAIISSASDPRQLIPNL